MARETRATKALAQAGIAFTVQSYAYDGTAQSIGLQAAQALGELPERVLKTLMVLVDGRPACVILPSHRAVAMKKLAAAFGGKSAQMMPAEDAERITGYKVGGISPFGQIRPVRVAMDESALAHDLVYINGGQRGLQIRLSPRKAASLLGARIAPLAA